MKTLGIENPDPPIPLTPHADLQLLAISYGEINMRSRKILVLLRITVRYGHTC